MTALEFSAAIRAFERELKRRTQEEVRAHWRETKGLIYVRKHTVQAYFRRARPAQH
jgi:hypothetical protein